MDLRETTTKDHRIKLNILQFGDHVWFFHCIPVYRYTGITVITVITGIGILNQGNYKYLYLFHAVRGITRWISTKKCLCVVIEGHGPASFSPFFSKTVSSISSKLRINWNIF